MQPLTARDASANDLFDCFDFGPPFAGPITLAERAITPRALPPNPFVP
ncbi:MAG: hypothetical protein ACRDHP_09660 [Ktedonobacterales bacterium]